jgi:hypothetical protein
MAAWTVTAEKAEGQLVVRVKGPASGPAAYEGTLLFKAAGQTGLVQMAQKADIQANGAAQALPLAVAWAQGMLDAWRTGLGA